ncbi:hypothetical protein NEMIN01_1307 [Nematocida minor]|uniref:uncharacterized protein n=1 Tax=Nematocida minor TaxID=1912983 RepID=UPI00221F6595|nr:uncharacterized protein NEMIN01_1307 [Nematocida minor]KAI5190974.1 hypothetical protein NEMIN01_1307 [Nematocida minor]
MIHIHDATDVEHIDITHAVNDNPNSNDPSPFEERHLATYKNVISFIKLAVYLYISTISISYTFDIFFIMHASNIVCFWSFVCFVAALFFTVCMWDAYMDRKKEKARTPESSVITVLISLFLIIPGIAVGNPWTAFIITNCLTRSLEYPLVAGGHLLFYLISSEYCNSSFGTFISIIPGIISVVSLIEYEFDMFYQKKIRITKHRVSATGLVTISALIFVLVVAVFGAGEVKHQATARLQ